MTRDEITKIAKVSLSIDGGCSCCIQSFLNDLLNEFHFNSEEVACLIESFNISTENTLGLMASWDEKRCKIEVSYV